MDPVIEMREIKEPKFVQFAREGESVEGVLQSIDVVEMAERDQSGAVIPGRKKKAARFVLLEGHLSFETGVFTPSGDRVCFIGTRQIIDSIKMGHLGYALIVRFEGADQSVSNKGNAMKRFKIYVSSQRVTMDESISTANDLGITDADISF